MYLVKIISNIITNLIIKIILLYQAIFSLIIPGAKCRFMPTCSNYATEALCKHGLWFGLYLTIKRLLSCHPLIKSKYDPVP